MNTPSLRRVERLEPRLAPAGLVAVSVSPVGILTLGTVPGQDGDEVVTVGLQADGSYRLTPGAGVSLRIGGTDFAAPQSVSGVTSGLAAHLGAGDDRLTLNGGSFPGSVAVDLGAGNNALTVDDWVVAGGLAVTAGAGIDTVTFSGTSVAVGGAFSARLGDGNNLVQTSLLMATFGSFRVAGGAGDDTLRVTQNDLEFITFAGGLTFNGGGGFGHDAVTLGDGMAQVATTGPVRVTGFGAVETVAIGGSRFEARSLQAVFGDGANTLTSTATELSLVGGLTWTGGTGADTLDVRGTDARIGGAVAIAVGDGRATVNFHPDSLLAVGRGVTIQAGATSAPSVLNVNSTSDIVIGGPVTITSGTGDAPISLFAPSSIAVGGPVRLMHGAGPGSMYVNTNGLRIGGSLSIVRADDQGGVNVTSFVDAIIRGSVVMSGGSSQSLVLRGVVAGGVTMTGAAGAETTMSLENIPGRPFQVHGPIRLTSRAAAGQTPTIIIRGVLAQGPVAVLGRAGAEELNIDNCAFLGSFTAALGAGDDQCNLERAAQAGGSTFAGPVRLRGGAGGDTFRIGGNAAANAIAFRAAVTVDGGDGADTLVPVGTQVTFDPAHPLVMLNIP